MVGGSTQFDGQLSALTDLLAEWTSGADYGTRVDRVTGTPGGANGPTYLTAVTVTDDGAKDVLTGGGGLDWFAAGAADVLDLKVALGEERLTVQGRSVFP